MPANTANRDKVKFLAPGDAAYSQLVATQMDVSDPAPATPGTRIYYQGFLNVTSTISAKGNGSYWVGDIQSAADTNTYAGWSLVVVLQNSIYPVRNLSVFDGFGKVAASAADTTVDIPVGPFLAPPFGTVNASIGMVTWEGDATIVGDKAMIKNGPATAATANSAFTVLADAASPANDFFNSSISKNGVNVTSRYPSDVNSLGVDIDQLAIPGLLPNGATDATIRLTTAGDTFLPGVVTFAVDLYTPSFPAITKTSVDLNGGTTVPGDQLEYTVSMPNTGLDPAVSVSFSDVLPPNTTYVPGSATVAAGSAFATYDSGTNRILAYVGTGATATSGGTINPTETVTIKFRVTVGTAAAGTVVHNQAKIDYTAKTLNKSFTYKSNITDNPVEDVADIAVVKSASPSPVVAGTNITYTLAVSNAGPNAASATFVSDKLPAGLTYVSASVTGAAAGSSCSYSAPTVACSLGALTTAATPTITIVATVDAALVAGSSLANTAAISSSTLDLNPANNSSAISTPVTTSADLGITKSVTPTPPVPGASATYLITVTNSGPSVSRSVQVTDALPAGFTATAMTPSVGTCTLATRACTVGDLAVGSSATVTVVGTVSSAAIGTLTNVATASSSTPDPTPVNTATVASSLAPSAELKVTKVASVARATAGAPLTYTVTVDNLGPSVARSVNVADTLPAGFTVASMSATSGSCTLATGACALGDLAVGATTISISGTVSAAFVGASLTNTATATDSTPDPGAQPNTASVTIPVDASADLELVKSVSPSSGLVAGQAVTYTIRVTNHGPSDAQSVVITDTMPSTIDTRASASCNVAANPITCAVGVLASGASQTVTITGKVVSGFSGSFIDNPASVASTTPDPGIFPNSATVRSTVVAQADLRLTKTAAPDPAISGNTVTYTLLATNDGPSDATGITVSDTVPAGITPISATAPGGCTIDVPTNNVQCTVGAMVAGTSATITITATIAPSTPAGPVGNTAIVNAATPGDPTLSNNTSTFVSTIQRRADLSVTKTPATQTVAAGALATWTVSVANGGPSTAEAASVADTLPAGMTFVSATGPGGITCSQSSGVISCPLGTLAPSGPPTVVTVVARIDAATAAGLTLTNRVTATSATPDPTTANNSASATLTTTTSADLTVSKTVSPVSVQAGGMALWTVVVTNAGPSDAQSVSLADAVPAGFTVSGISSSLGSCTLATTTCSVGTLAAGSTATIQVTGTVATGYLAASMTNSATASSATADPNAANSTGTAVATVTTLADLKVSKSASPNPVVAGDPLSYTLTLTNGGPSAALNVVLTDALPADFTAPATSSPGCAISGAGVLSCSYPTLAPGMPVVVTVTGLVSPTMVPGPLSNTASATSATPESTPGDNSSSTTVQVTAKADLLITKSADTSPAFAGDVFNWTISVSNSGPSTSRNVIVTDPLPASVIATTAVGSASVGACSVSGNIVSCSLGDLAPGGIETVKIAAQIDPTATAGLLINTASVAAATSDPNAANNASSATVPMERVANVRLTKTASPAAVRAGNTITWTITATNAGPSTADATTIVDTLPTGVTGVVFTPSQGSCSGTTCLLGVIPAHASASVTVTATVIAGYASSSVDNSASVTSTTPDSTSGDNVAAVSTPIVREADLGVIKSVTPATLVAGQSATYRLDLTNAGPSDATSVVATDVLPGGLSYMSATGSVGGPCTYTASTRVVSCPLGTVAPGDLPFVTIVVAVAANQAPSSTIANTATVASATTDPSASNNSSTTKSTVATSADLTITKSASPTPLVPGRPASYTITVTNAGPSVAADVQVGDVVPAGFAVTGATSSFGSCTTGGSVACQLGSLPVGQSAVITISGSVDEARTSSITNTATVTSSTTDPTPLDHTASVTSPVAPSADLRIRKTVDTATRNAGEGLRYTIDIVNDGPSVATAVIVDETPPAGITISAIATPVGSCAITVSGRRCTLGDVAPGASVTITVTATVDATAAAGTLNNTATVSSSTADPDAANDSSDAAVTVAVASDVAVSKTMTPTTLTAGQPVTYTLVVVNNGPSAATGVVLSDPMPAGITAGSATGVPGCVVGGTVTCSIGALAVGATATVVITGTVAAAATSSTSVNTATVTSTSADPTAANNSSSTTANLTTAADLSITKTASPNPVLAGNTVTYTLFAHNAGPSDAAAVTIADTLPSGILPSSATWPAGTCSLIGRSVTCNVGAVTNGANVVVTIVGTVGAGVPVGPLTNTATVSSPTADPSPGNNSASVTSTIDRSADLTTTKTVSPTSAPAGSTVVYHLSTTNGGPSTAESTQLRDTLPAGMTLISATASTGSCTIAGNSVTCSVGTLASGATASADVTARIDASTSAGTITNAATATSATPDPTPGDNTATAPLTVRAASDLLVTKVPSVTSARAGDPLTWTVTVTNIGPSDAQTVTLTDTIPSGFTVASLSPSLGSCTGSVCTVPTLSAGSTLTLVVTGTIDASLRTTPLTNSAAVTSATPDPDSSNNTASSAVTVSTMADLHVTKSATPAQIVAGQTVVWTVAVRNDGPSDAQSVTVSDALPTGVLAVSLATTAGTCTPAVSCSLGTVAAGSTVTITISGTIDPRSSADSIVNTASVSSPTSDDDPTDNAASVSSPVTTQADLSLAKSGPATVVAGMPISWTVVVHNAGPSTARDVIVGDPIPSGISAITTVTSQGTCGGQVSCTLGDVAPGTDVTITVSGTVDSGVSAALVNSASVSSPTPDPDETDRSATVTTAVTVSADVRVSKTASPNPVRAGELMTWTVAVTNLGPSDAQGVVVHEALPSAAPAATIITTQGSCSASDCTLGTVAAGTTVTLTVRGVVDSTTPAGPITNSATATSTTPDPDTGNDTGSVTSLVVRAADLSLVKSATPEPVRAGDQVTYTLAITNAGPSTAEGVIVTDAVPSGISFATVPADCTLSPTTIACTPATLAVGATTVITLVGTVDSAQPIGSSIANRATVSAATPDPDGGNNSSTATSSIATAADLRVTKAVSPSPLVPGAAATYTITVTNAGPSVARAVSVADALPSAFVSAGATLPVSGCSGTSLVSCNLGDLAPGSSLTIVIPGVVDAGVTAPVTNTATATSPTFDPAPSDNAATITTPVAPLSDLAVTKQLLTSPVVAGKPVTYEIRVTNAGPSTAQAVVVADTLMSPLVFTSVSSTTGSCTQAGGTISCTLGNLAPAGEAVITVVAQLPSDAAITLAGAPMNNTVSATTTTAQSNTANDSAKVGASVQAVADLRIVKTADQNPISAGTTGTYTITVTNLGPSDAVDVAIDDTMPANVTATAVSNPDCAISVAGESVSCLIAVVPAGQTATVNITFSAGAGIAGNPVVNTATTSSPTDASGTKTATLTSNVMTSADLAVSKSVSPSTQTAGLSAVYLINIVNHGPAVAADATITDTLPAGVHFDPATPPYFVSGAGTCTVSAQTMTCITGLAASGGSPAVTSAINVNDTDTIRVITIIDADAPAGSLLNSATATSSTQDPTDSNNTGTATLAVNRSAEVSITKTAVAPAATAGSSAAWDITITNAGPSTAQDTVISDSLPAGTQFVSAVSTVPGGPLCASAAPIVTCDAGTLAVGASVTVRLTVAVSASFAPGTTVNNTATVTSTTPDPVANNSASASIAIAAETDLSLTKVASTPSVDAGGSLLYTLTFTNNGPSAAVNVVLADQLSVDLTPGTPSVSYGSCDPVVAGAVRCTVASLAAGATVTVQIPVTVASLATPGTLVNSASVSSDTPEYTGPGNRPNTASASTTITASASLSLTKVADLSSFVAGSTVSWTITVTNAGPSAAQSVSITDAIPAGVTGVSAAISVGSCVSATCDISVLDAGASATMTLTGTLAASFAATKLTNSASATSPTMSGGPALATVTTPVKTRADLSVAKTSTPATVTAGEAITWTITVTNAGPSDAQSVSVADVLPTDVAVTSVTPTQGTCSASISCLLGVVPALATVTVVVTGIVSSNTAQTFLINTASVSSPTVDPDTSNQSASVTTPLITRADLQVSKTATTLPMVPGRPVGWLITITNNGPSTARSVELLDVLPLGQINTVSLNPSQGTCDGVDNCLLGDLSSGAVATIAVSARLNADATGPTITNSAEVTSTTNDPTPNNASVTSPLTPMADLHITKTGAPDPVVAGQTVTWTIEVRNDGPSDAAGVVVHENMPSALVMVSSGGCVPAAVGSGLDCPIGALLNGAISTITIVARVPAEATFTSTSNTASVESTTADPDLTDNATAATVAVSASADLSVTKTVTPLTVTAGQPVSWTITVTNAGPSWARAVQISDVVPAGISNIVATASQGSCAVAASVTCTLGDLADSGAAASATVVITADVLASFVAGSLDNQASASSATTDPTPHNTAAVQAPSSASADITLTKTTSSTVMAGQRVTWTITVTNNGPSDAQTVTLSDALPAGLTNVTASTTQGSCSGLLQCELATVTPGTPVVVTVTADLDPNALGTLNNTATVRSATSDANDANNDATAASTVITQADLHVTKSATPSPAIPGTPLTWVIIVGNLGPSTARAVDLAELLPAGISGITITPGQGTCDAAGACHLGDIAAGTTATVTVTALVDATLTTSLVNTASVRSSTTLVNPADDTVTLTTPVRPQADVSITKTGPSGAVVPGTAVSWTITVANAGPSTAHGVVVSDPLPTGLRPGATATSAAGVCTISAGTVSCTMNPINNGSTVTVVVAGVLDASYVSPSVSNTATLTSPDDTTPANNSANATNSAIPQADVQVVVTPSAATAVAGMPLGFTITVTNAGVSDAANSVLTFPVPAGYTLSSASGCTVTLGIATCAVGTLAAGASRTFTLVGLVGSAYLGTSLSLAASATTTTLDTAPANNSASASVSISAHAVLDIAKVASGGAAAIGQTVTYTVTLHNSGPSVAPNATITDVLPSALQGVSISAPGATCSMSGQQGSCVSPTLAVGESLVASITATVVASGTVTNTASGSANVAGDANTPTAAATVVVASLAHLRVTKTLNFTKATLGEVVTYTIVVTDLGPDAATGVVVDEPMPASLVLAGATASAGVFDSTIMRWQVGDLANGQSATLVIRAKLNANGIITNTVTAHALNTDVADAVQATATVEVTPPPVTRLPVSGANSVRLLEVAAAAVVLGTTLAIADRRLRHRQRG